MRVPRRKGPRPTQSPFEPIVTDTEVFHPVRSAASVLGKGVRTVNKLTVPFETFPEGHYYKESALRAHMEALEEQDRRERAARQQNRREIASLTHTSHDTWVDDDGFSQPLSKHENEEVCRNLFRRLSKTPEQMCPEWRENRARLTYEITDELGICPPGYRPETVIPGEEFNPDTVLYVPIRPVRRREHDVLEIAERRQEAERQRRAATGGSGDFTASERGPQPPEDPAT